VNAHGAVSGSLRFTFTGQEALRWRQAALTVATAPADAKEVWKDHAVFSGRFKSEPGQVTATRSLTRAFTFAKAAEYTDLRGFYQKVAAADQVQLVLAVSASEKGN